MGLTKLLIVGLTGGIGSGKSSFCDVLSEMGVPIIDADKIAHGLDQPYSKANTLVSNEFGLQSLTQDGKLDRNYIREQIFNDASKKEKLEAILHPLIVTEIKAQIKNLSTSNPYCILAIPLLFEYETFRQLCQFSIVIDCSEEEQIKRVMQRNNLNRDQISLIIKSQLSRTQRNGFADLVINNEEGRSSIAKKVSQLHRFLLEKT